MTCGRVGSGLVTASTQWIIPKNYGPHGELLFLLMQKKPAFVPDSEAFNSFIGDGFRVTELKGGSEASDGAQADNVSNEALYVIGSHGFCDFISFCLWDWEMAKVAHGPGHAVPGNVRTGKETWLVRFLNEPVG